MQDSSNQKLLLATNMSSMSSPPISLSFWKRKIKETFENEFCKQKFEYLIGNILNTFERNTYKKDCTHNNFSNLIKSIERMGRYKDPNGKTVDILMVDMRKETSLYRARAQQRNYIARYLKNSQKDAALVAFISPSKSWRFSFVKMDYKFDENRRVTETFTPRRYSFLVGKNEASHTAQNSFMPLLENDNENPTLETLESAFSVEKVTEKFYKEYYKLFNHIKNHIENEILEKDQRIKIEFNNKQIRTDDFAKKLLGQIVFLYFIQRKGWFEVDKTSQWGTGNKNFLRKTFDTGDYNNFFNEILEPLFYEVLSKKRKNDNWDKFNCRIPFLNGGLFEPYKNYDYKNFQLNLPNILFSNDEIIEDGEQGSGILDVFDRYNFTVKEDEPLEKEVAIDPEMLGRIFESLIPENERRRQGAYYTPREIVHYMCEESLIHCLESEFQDQINKEDIEKFIRHEYNSITQENLPVTIDKNKNNIDHFLERMTICDPAVGSGAFPVAIMLKIIKLRELLNSFNFNIYEAKLKCIENSLYGVDNDEGSVEVAKLRLWLSLIVDEEKTTLIRPLPNLEYKIMSGNSLLSKVEGLFKSQVKKELKILEKQKKLFFSESEDKKKTSYRKYIETLFENIVGKSKLNNATLFKKFYFEVYFSEVMKKRNGFDILITNPPYLRQEELQRLEYKSKLESQGFNVYTSSMDIYGYFYEKAFHLLKNKGTSAFITSNKWLRATYGKKLRKFFEDKVKVNNILDFKSNKIFSSATVDTNILVFQKQAVGGEYSVPYADFSDIKLNKPIHEQFNTRLYEPDMEGAPWLLLNDIEKKIKEKIREKGIQLKSWDIDFHRGIITGYNDAFIIDSETKNRLCREHPSSKKIITPLLRGRDIKKWHYDWKNLWLINSHNGIKNETEPINVKKDYPAIWNHLKKINKEKNKKVERRCDQGVHWSNLRSCDYLGEFEKEKIIYPNMTKNVWFVYDKKKMHINQKCYIITSSDKEKLKFIIGQLNSVCLRFFIKKTFPHLQGGTVELNKDKSKNLHLLPIEKFTGTDFIKYVNNIIDITSSKDYSKNDIKKQKVKSFQNKIDQIIFDLYELNQKEREYMLQ